MGNPPEYIEKLRLVPTGYIKGVGGPVLKEALGIQTELTLEEEEAWYKSWRDSEDQQIEEQLRKLGQPTIKDRTGVLEMPFDISISDLDNREEWNMAHLPSRVLQDEPTGIPPPERVRGTLEQNLDSALEVVDFLEVGGQDLMTWGSILKLGKVGEIGRAHV